PAHPCYSCFLFTAPPPPTSALFPYTTLFRSEQRREWTYLGYRRARVGDICRLCDDARARAEREAEQAALAARILQMRSDGMRVRSEEHTSELQSRENLVCRLLLEKKK